jgi:hypothetical protein
MSSVPKACNPVVSLSVSISVKEQELGIIFNM